MRNKKIRPFWFFANQQFLVDNNIMEPKQFGELCEMEFAMIATRRGLIVSKPMLEQKYDFIVDNGEKLLRVQVKSTRSRNYEKNTPTFGVMISHGRESKKLYNKNQIDIFAIYIEPEKTWYFIPIGEINCARISIAPNAKKSKYNKFKEAWNLIQ